jgi:hypothetical protein
MALDIEKILKNLSLDDKKLPPIHLWHPEHVGEIDICIDDNMRWWHEGEIFQRESLVRLFASILRKEGDTYFLVTPAEKLAIVVEDVPFEIINMLNDGSTKVFITNTEDKIFLTQESQWQLRDYQGVNIPYVLVRDDLWARVNRTVYYQMIEEAAKSEQVSETQIYLQSAGNNYLLGSSE